MHKLSPDLHLTPDLHLILSSSHTAALICFLNCVFIQGSFWMIMRAHGSCGNLLLLEWERAELNTAPLLHLVIGISHSVAILIWMYLVERFCTRPWRLENKVILFMYKELKKSTLTSSICFLQVWFNAYFFLGIKSFTFMQRFVLLFYTLGSLFCLSLSYGWKKFTSCNL